MLIRAEDAEFVLTLGNSIRVHSRSFAVNPLLRFFAANQFALAAIGG
jgi:hypothetical protein